MTLITNHNLAMPGNLPLLAFTGLHNTEYFMHNNTAYIHINDICNLIACLRSDKFTQY